MDAKQLAKYIDHTILKPDATRAQVLKLCDEAKAYGFASVCVNPSRVALAAEALRGTDVKPCCVVGFPLGATPTESKAAEAAVAVKNGAQEIDMVIDVGAAKDGDWAYVQSDIAGVKSACGPALLKVIIETCLLTDDEKVRACLAAKAAGADFVKTSTGFSKAGATVHDVQLMRDTVGPDMGVKAAGGIHTRAEAEAMIAAGATRIGASAGIAIIKEDKT
ncbi:MAG: deoxyribose-phosphate aldolase [Clostridia bacterium]|nr:deoxyribose-phosphate aldolase [Clostridia bacterium]